MSGIAVRGTTFNLPNYHGELIAVSPQDTPFTSAIGGIVGGLKTVHSVEHEWQTYDLRAADKDRQRLEGADAPTAEARVRANVKNVVEVHQEAVDVSYTKLAASGQFAGVNNDQGANPVQDENAWQITQQITQVKRDFEAAAVNGTYQLPSDNTTPRKMRGILAAMSTNVIVKASTPNPTKADIIDLLQLVWDNGGIQESEAATLMVNSVMKRWVTKLFITDANYQESSRTVGGVKCMTIETDFGTLNVMLNRYVPQSVISVVSLDQCKPVALEIPNKGVLFVEPLAKTGASEKAQVYGELGLEYGNEKSHGKITGYAPTAPTS